MPVSSLTSRLNSLPFSRVTTLCLGGLAPPIGAVVATAGQDVKKRQDVGLLAPSLEVTALLASLDFGSLSPPVGAGFATVGQNV